MRGYEFTFDADSALPEYAPDSAYHFINMCLPPNPASPRPHCMSFPSLFSTASLATADMHQVFHTQGSQLRPPTRNCLTPQRMFYQPEDMPGTRMSLPSKCSNRLMGSPIHRLLGSPIQDPSLSHDKPWCRSQPSHHHKRDLEVDLGYGSPMHHVFSGHLNGKNGIQSNEPDFKTDRRCRSLSEGDPAVMERCFAGKGVNPKHSELFSAGFDSLVQQSQPLSAVASKLRQFKEPSPATEICGTASSSSQMIAHHLQLMLYLLELMRKIVERETFPSRDRTGQVAMDDLKEKPKRQNTGHKQSSGVEVSPTDASDIKNDQSSKRSLSTSEHHNQEKRHNPGSNHSKRDDGKDEGGDDSHGGESPGQNSRRLSETETSSRQFACPYQKRFSGLLPKDSSCCFLGFATVDLMKEHLYHEHSQLDSERPGFLDTLMYAQPRKESLQMATEGLASSNSVSRSSLRLTSAQMDELKRAPESDPEDERWRTAWRIIFAEDKEALEEIPSPYCNPRLIRSSLFDERYHQSYLDRTFQECTGWITSWIQTDHPDLHEDWEALLPDITRSVQQKQCYPSPENSAQSSFYPDPMDDDCSCIALEWGLSSSAQEATDLSSETTPSEADQEMFHLDDTFGDPSDLHNLTDPETSSALHLLASLESIIQQHSSDSDNQRVFYFFSGLLKDVLEHRSVLSRASDRNETCAIRFLTASESGHDHFSTNIGEGIKTQAGNTGSGSSSPSDPNRQDLDSPGRTPGGFSASNKKRSADDEKGPGGGSGPGKRKRAKNFAEDNEKRLACPYFKRYPRSSAIVRACVLPGFSDPNRLIEHLKRCHELPGYPCYSCFQCFQTPRAVQDHIRTQPCSGNGERRIGYTPDQRVKLNAIKRKLSHEEKWRQIWLILFEDDELAKANVPSPYSGNTISMCLGMMRQGIEDLPEARQREATQLLDTLNTIFSGHAVLGGDESTAPSPRTSSLPETPELEGTSEIGLAHRTTLRNDEARIGSSSIQQMNHRIRRQPQMSCISTNTQALPPNDPAGNTQHAVNMLSPASSVCENTPSVGIPPWNNFSLQNPFFDPTNGSWAANANAESFPSFDPSALDPQNPVNSYQILQDTALTQPPFSTMDNSTRTSGGWNGNFFS